MLLIFTSIILRFFLFINCTSSRNDLDSANCDKTINLFSNVTEENVIYKKIKELEVKMRQVVIKKDQIREQINSERSNKIKALKAAEEQANLLFKNFCCVKEVNKLLADLENVTNYKIFEKIKENQILDNECAVEYIIEIIPKEQKTYKLLNFAGIYIIVKHMIKELLVLIERMNNNVYSYISHNDLFFFESNTVCMVEYTENVFDQIKEMDQLVNKNVDAIDKEIALLSKINGNITLNNIDNSGAENNEELKPIVKTRSIEINNIIENQKIAKEKTKLIAAKLANFVVPFTKSIHKFASELNENLIKVLKEKKNIFDELVAADDEYDLILREWNNIVEGVSLEALAEVEKAVLTEQNVDKEIKNTSVLIKKAKDEKNDGAYQAAYESTTAVKNKAVISREVLVLYEKLIKIANLSVKFRSLAVNATVNLENVAAHKLDEKINYQEFYQIKRKKKEAIQAHKKALSFKADLCGRFFLYKNKIESLNQQ